MYESKYQLILARMKGFFFEEDTFFSSNEDLHFFNTTDFLSSIKFFQAEQLYILTNISF